MMVITTTIITDNKNSKCIINTVSKLVYREEENIQMKIYAVQFT